MLKRHGHVCSTAVFETLDITVVESHLNLVFTYLFCGS